MTNKEFQELIDQQPVFALSCVSASISKLNEENFNLQDEVERLTAEITEWKSKFYEEAIKVDKAIEYLEAVNKSNQKIIILVNKQDLLNILKGVDEDNENS